MVLCSVSVICALQGHAGLWNRVEMEGVGGWGAGVGQLMAPSGQIFANYTTNYTVGYRASWARVNNNTVSPLTLWIKVNLDNPSLSPHPCFVSPFLWHTYRVFSPKVHSSLLPLLLTPFMKSPPPQRVTVYSCFILGSRDPTLQPPDSSLSQNPQPTLVRSALAMLNKELQLL